MSLSYDLALKGKARKKMEKKIVKPLHVCACACVGVRACVCVREMPSSFTVPALQGKKNIPLNPHPSWNEETEFAKQDCRLVSKVPDSLTSCAY